MGDLVARYDRAAAGWQRRIAQLGYPAAYAHLMARALADGRPAGAVLDAGTGSGAMARALVAQARGGVTRLVLLDPSRPMLDEAATALRARVAGGAAGEVEAARVETVLGAIGSKGVADRFDTVLCGHVIEHLDDPLAALAWLRDRLAPGGRLVLAVSRPHWCTALIRAVWGSRAYPPARVCAMLRQAGCTGISVVPFPAGPPSRTSCGYVAAAGPAALPGR